MPWSKNRKVGVYLRNEFFFAFPYFLTDAGVSLAGTPVATFACSISTPVLGEATFATTDKCKFVAHPDFRQRRSSVVAEAAGLKSWATFSKTALYCEISIEGDNLSVIPSRRDPIGYQLMPEAAIKLPRLASAEQIGAALREAFTRSM